MRLSTLSLRASTRSRLVGGSTLLWSKSLRTRATSYLSSTEGLKVGQLSQAVSNQETKLISAPGFKGQSRVILPSINSCYECTVSSVRLDRVESKLIYQMSLITPATAYPICTIANTPRLPEHCIEWASVLEWPKVFKGEYCTIPA